MPALCIAVPCRCRHRRRAHGLDDYLVLVGGPEATALATTVSRSLMSSTSPVGSSPRATALSVDDADDSIAGGVSSRDGVVC